MNSDKDNAAKPLTASQDLDSLLSEFLDKEIGSPAEKDGLAPEIDRMLAETLQEIGLVDKDKVNLQAVADTDKPEATTEPSQSPDHQPSQRAATSQPSSTTATGPSVPPPVARPPLNKPRADAHGRAAPIRKVQQDLASSMAEWRLDLTQNRILLLAGGIVGAIILAFGTYHLLAPDPAPVKQKLSSTQRSEASTSPISGLDKPKVQQKNSRRRVFEDDTPDPDMILDGPINLASPSVTTSTQRSVPDLVEVAPVSSLLGSASPAQSPAGLVTADMAISKVRPVYPQSARRENLKGRVEVDVTVDARGRVVRATAVSGPPALRPAAETALRQWLFNPPRVKGQNAPGRGKISVIF